MRVIIVHPSLLLLSLSRRVSKNRKSRFTSFICHETWFLFARLLLILQREKILSSYFSSSSSLTDACFPGRFPNFAPSRMKNIVWNKRNEMKHVARCTIQGETLHRSTHEEVPFEDFAQGRLPSIISSPRLYSGRLSTSRAASRFSRVSHALFVISIRQGTFQTRGWTRLTRDTCCSFLPFSLSSFLLVLFVYLQSQR